MNEKGLYLMDFNPSSIYADIQCVNEYNRLRKSANMNLLDPANVQPPIVKIFKKKARKVKVNIPKNTVLLNHIIKRSLDI